LGLLLIPSWLQHWADGTLPPRFAVTEEPRGALALPSGKIVAHGLITGDLMLVLPYTRGVPPGTYELVCGMLRGRVAFAAMRFSTTPIVTWEGAEWDFAGIPDTRANRSNWMRIVDGVQVFDIGNGNTCFVDGKVARDHTAWCSHWKGTISLRLLNAGKRDAEFRSAFKDAIAREAPDPMDKIVDLQRSADLPRGGNAISVRPGNRSRGFSSFFGLDDRGVPVALVTNFSMIHIPAPLARATAVLEAWEREKLVEIARYARRDPLLAALAEQLDAVDHAPAEGRSAELASWLFDRPEVTDVHGVDDILDASVKTVDKQLITSALGAGAL
jgi:hypothetical protein